jgi:hypothetical protein
METMIACCGLICTDCPAFIATKANDEKKAQKTADLWAKQFGVKVAVAHVWCDGCTVGGKKCAHCAECEIRACAMGRGAANCGRCPDFSCDKTEKFFAMVPPAREVLEKEAKER